MIAKLLRFALVLLGASAAPLLAQPFTCTAVAVPNLARIGDRTAKTADLVLTCTGGTPTPEMEAVPEVDFALTFSSNVTSRLLYDDGESNFASEALLLVDEPAPADQLACESFYCTLNSGSPDPYDGQQGHPNVFQAQQFSDTGLVWALALDPPGPSGMRILRFTNLKIDALGLDPLTQVQVTVAAEAELDPPAITNPLITVAFAQTGAIPSVASVLGSVNGLSAFTIRMTEGFAEALRTRTAADFVDSDTSPDPVDQNVPGTFPAGSETGFYNSAFPPETVGGNLSLAGLADNGTRMIFHFDNIPLGVYLTVPYTVPLKNGGTTTGVARLADVDSSGIGDFSPLDSNNFYPSNGTVDVVYEILQTDPFALETVDIPFTVAYFEAPVYVLELPLTAGLAPVSPPDGADAIFPHPRFNGMTALTPAAPPPHVILSCATVGIAGKPYSCQVSASDGTPPFVSFTAMGLPGGLSISSGGLISGIPLAPGFSFYMVTVTDSAMLQDTGESYLTILPPVVILTGSLPGGQVGEPYLESIDVTGGYGDYAFTLASGSLPSGLTLSCSPFVEQQGKVVGVRNSNCSGSGGIISGTPTRAGTFTFTLRVDDSDGDSAMRTYTVKIVSPLKFVTPSPLVSGVAGTPYSASIFATGGVPPYNFAAGSPEPPGLRLSSDGDISGTPTAPGTFNLLVRLSDQTGAAIDGDYQIQIDPAPQVLQPSEVTLDFTAVAGGDPPPAQSVALTTDDQQQGTYDVSIGGTGAGAAVTGASAGKRRGAVNSGFLSVDPADGRIPARFTVSADQTGLSPGVYSTQIAITNPSDRTRGPVAVNVNFTVSAGEPALEATPAILRFEGRDGFPEQFEKAISVRNAGGGGAISFTASLAGGSSWVSISPGAGQTVRGGSALVKVQVDTTGLTLGQYRDVVRVQGAGATIEIPVTLFVAASGPILDVGGSGVQFRTRQGETISTRRQVTVINRGGSGTTVRWSADRFRGGEGWLDLSPASGIATPGNPATLGIGLRPEAATLGVGVYYALVRVSDPGSMNNPKYVAVVLQVVPASSPTLLDFEEAGTVFLGMPGSATPVSHKFRIGTSSSIPVAFRAAASTDDGADWLSVTPATGPVSSLQAAEITVTAKASLLTAGIYKGEVVFQRADTVRSLNITFIVADVPAPAADAPRTVKSGAAAACVPDRLAVTQTGLTNHFVVPAGFPSTLIVKVNDNCQNAIRNAAVTANFTSGDATLALLDDGTGTYSATWEPRSALAQVNVNVRASFEGLTSATAQVIGDVNQNLVPSLTPNGIIHNLNPLTGGPLAPGLVAQIFGTDLAGVSESTGTVPLPTTYKGTNVLIGPYEAPLYYVSPGQLVVQLPSELQPNQQYDVVASVNDVYAIGGPLDLVNYEPGVAAFPDGRLIAQHADFSLVDDQHPAHPGEPLIIYLVGLGATTPAVPSGAPSPGDTLAQPQVPPTVTVDGQSATIGFAGLTPFGVGLYQINFVVPQGVRTGTPVNVVVEQSGVPANVTTLTLVP